MIKDLNKDEEKFFKVVQALLTSQKKEGISISKDFIAEQMELFIPVFSGKEINHELVKRELESFFSHTIDEEATGLIDGDDHEPWLESKRGEIEWNFWDRFIKFKSSQDGFNQSAIDVIDDITDKVLGSIEDPNRKGPWDRRGLVIGHVQSGKTSTYTGLINKAADAGYKFFIILAGLHNNLRAQTQLDIDEGFLGRNSLTKEPCGVYDFGTNIKINPDCYTNRSENGDFKTSAFRGQVINLTNGGIKVLVIKKNKSPLENLTNWFESFAPKEEFVKDIKRKFYLDESLLIIDDESDQASVDTKRQEFDLDGESREDHDPSTINYYIRKILNMFEKSAYVGFTATPFANILINEGSRTNELGPDLFPKSFIYNIPTQNNYYGAEKVFGLKKDDVANIEYQSELPIIKEVDDYIDPGFDEDVDDELLGWMPPKVNKDHVPLYQGKPELPPSLKKAIQAFILATTIRRIREGKSIFNSMLIHVTRFADVQHRVMDQVREYLKEIDNEIRHGSIGEGIYLEIENIWKNSFINTIDYFDDLNLGKPSWTEIQSELKSTARSIEPREINGKAKEALEYKKNEAQGWNVIAVGGEKLSRGLVLHGLTISYFLRTSSMYDTLMQMGRWFGYKEKYIDVCRLYLSEDLNRNFKAITNATNELRKDFDYMVEIGSKPTEFGIKIRSHPGLTVTSKSKMRASDTERISYSNKITQTILFDIDNDILDSNLASVKALIEEKGFKNYIEKKHRSRSLMWTGFKSEDILNFFERYITREDAEKATPKAISTYIRLKNNKNELLDWNIVIASVGIDPNGENDFSNNFWNLDIGGAKRSSSISKNKLTIGVLVNPIDESFDLNDDEYDKALAQTIRSWRIRQINKNKTSEQPKIPNGTSVRELRDRKNGLLIIYPIKIKDIDKPVIGFACSFPKSSTDDAVTYVVPKYQNIDYII